MSALCRQQMFDSWTGKPQTVLRVPNRAVVRACHRLAAAFHTGCKSMGPQLTLHGLRALWGATPLPFLSRCIFRSLHVRTAAADGPHLIRRVAVVAIAKLPCFARKYEVQNEWELRGRHHSK